MEDHFARTGAAKATVLEGSKHASIVEPKAADQAKDKRRTAKEIDKHEVIGLIAQGLSYHKVEEQVGIPKGTLRYRLKKWGLVGLDQIKAKELLGSAAQPEDMAVQNASLKDYEQKLAEWDSLNQELQQLRIEHTSLKKDYEELSKLHEDSANRAKILLDRCLELEEGLKKWNDNDNETQELLLEIMAERDQLSKHAAEVQVQFAEMLEDRNNWKQTALEAKQAIAELEALRGLGVTNKTADNVNSPAHYTQGGIETIDYIRAKLTPEEFIGYCKGNILKYVSRASHKGGLEDLRKAGKYIEFAVKS
ncbi:DUF3310 domain-containing protein [Paenibacillus montaniterrae]|nr:DUF3310 domain-containing protein [Paenibacillus montaniterrae]